MLIQSDVSVPDKHPSIGIHHRTVSSQHLCVPVILGGSGEELATVKPCHDGSLLVFKTPIDGTKLFRFLSFITAGIAQRL
jgi:hypothetical protein